MKQSSAMTQDAQAKCGFGVCNMTAFVAQLPIVKEAEIFVKSKPYLGDKIVQFIPSASGRCRDSVLLLHSQSAIYSDVVKLAENGKFDTAIALITICGHYLDSNSCILLTCVCMEQFSPREYMLHCVFCNDLRFFLANGERIIDKIEKSDKKIRHDLRFENVEIARLIFSIQTIYAGCIKWYKDPQNKERTLHQVIFRKRKDIQVLIDKLIGCYLQLSLKERNNNGGNNDSFLITQFERRIKNEINDMFEKNAFFKYLAQSRVATKKYTTMTEEEKQCLKNETEFVTNEKLRQLKKRELCKDKEESKSDDSGMKMDQNDENDVIIAIDNNKRECATNGELRLLRNEQVKASRMAKEAEREELRKRGLASYKDIKRESEKQNESEKEDASTKIKQNGSTANNHDEMDDINESKNNEIQIENDTTLTRWQRRLLRQRQKVDYENGFDSKFEEKPDKYKREASFDGKYDIYRCNETIDFQNGNGEWKRIKNSTTLVATASVPELPHPFKVVVQVRNTSTLDVDADDTKSNQNDNPPNDTEMQ